MNILISREAHKTDDTSSLAILIPDKNKDNFKLFHTYINFYFTERSENRFIQGTRSLFDNIQCL